MSYPISLELKQKQASSLKQMQRLIMSPQMQQALHLLQAPIMELEALIEAELEQNPCLEVSSNESTETSEDGLLEQDGFELKEDINASPEKELTFDEHDFNVLRQIDEEFREYFRESGSYQKQWTSEDDKLRTYIESSIQAEMTLFEYLMQQARETFSKKEEMVLAEALIGNIDEQGYLKTPLKEIAQLTGKDEKQFIPILKQIQTFEPYGIGASSLQESMLIQLECLKLNDTLAYKIIESHFDDLIHNRIPNIQKGLGCDTQEIAQAIKQDIAKLDLHPGTWFSREPVQMIIPDVSLTLVNDKLVTNVNDDQLPAFHLNRRYLKMLDDENLSQETKDFIRQKIMSAKWLMKNIWQRNDTLERITKFLAEKQREFFINPEGKLTPLTMKTVAQELELHESTIARAVAGKYLDSPRGLLPLRSFFTNAYLTAGGEDISSRTVRDILLDIVHKENKRKPLSDEAIAAKIKEFGIPCARRTVAKYRAELNIGNAHQRRQY